MRITFGYPDVADAVVDLTKGRRTSAPQRHTGEGIFFTSKAVDTFSLDANNDQFSVDNAEGDIALGEGHAVGTVVTFTLDLDTTRDLVGVFEPSPRTVTSCAPSRACNSSSMVLSFSADRRQSGSRRGWSSFARWCLTSLESSSWAKGSQTSCSGVADRPSRGGTDGRAGKPRGRVDDRSCRQALNRCGLRAG